MSYKEIKFQPESDTSQEQPPTNSSAAIIFQGLMARIARAINNFNPETNTTQPDLPKPTPLPSPDIRKKAS